MRRHRFALLPLFFALLFPLSLGAAADNPRQPPKVKLRLDSTPMRDAMDQQIESKKKNHDGTDDDCDKAVKGHNDENVIKHCKVPKVTKHDAVVTDVQGADHKLRGKRVETETTYECDTPEHCGMSQWPGYTVKPEELDPEGGDPKNNAAGLRVRRIVTANSTAINNDLDCVDTLTLEHHGGFVRDENNNFLIGQTYPNGHEQSCFDAQGTLKRNLEVIAGGCRHANGTTFETSECQARNFTTLEETTDEDPPAAAGQPAYDRDGDGVSGEDGPDISDTGGLFSVAANETPCARKGGVLLEDGSCDFGRKVRLEVKKKLKDNGHDKGGWKVDANGDCDAANGEGDVECGQEARRVTRTEWYALRCPEGAEYVDGRCLVPTPPEQLQQLRASGDSIAPEMVLTSTAEAIVDDHAMMGFTWALPKVEWGINEVEEVCIFGFCFEVFALRFGYDFDLAFGLRLPVQVEITPDEGTSAPVQAGIVAPKLATPEPVLAGDARSYIAKLTPVDFTVQQYKEFCLKHQLVQKGKIPSCDRFAFADYFWDQIMGDSDPSHVQGSEFVAQMVIWAGAQMRILMIPIFDWSVGVDFNLPAMCTMWKVYNFQGNPIGLVVDLAKGRDWLTTIDDNMLNCSTFVTPFGYKTSILNPTEKILRSFPFLTGTFTIDADCAIAKAKGWAASLGGKQIPLCTHLSYYGIGVGLKFVAAAGSTHIGANWSVSGDASPGDHGPVDFYDTEAAGPNAPPIGPVHFDNHDLNSDEAKVKLNDFTYYLDTLQFRIEAVPQILNFSLLSIPVYSLEFEGLDILSLGQHPGTEPITMTVPVRNFGLKVKAGTAANPEEKTLLVKPGDFGYFKVAIQNEGTETDTFGHFVRQLTNRPNQTAPFQFVMNHNLDFDCTDPGGTVSKYRGNPYDGIADDCYTADGQPRSDRAMLEAEDGPGPGTGPVATRDEDKDGYADEDPAGDDWLSSPDAPGFHAQSISGVPKHSLSTSTLMLGVKPFLHPLTAPGLYPVSIQADSLGAIAANLTTDDASGIKRTGAEDIVYVRVDSFFDPKIALSPVEAAVKPGGSTTYGVETSNGGNSDDTIQLLRVFGDSNRAACTLTTLGTLPAGENPGCPYRAVVTMIPAGQWTDIGALGAQFGPLAPLGSGGGQFTIQVPRDWAGMQDTIYDVVFTSQSSMAPVHNDLTLKHKVLATKESMTRYLNLEVAEFLAQITAADAQGISARGIQPVMLHPVTMMTTKALEQILAGDLGGAAKTLSSAIHVMEAVDRMVRGATLPEPQASDWKARSTAILADMAAAQASTVPSLP